MKSILILLSMVFFSNAHAMTTVTFENEQATEIINDLGLNSNIPVKIRLVGYVTERAKPPVKYTDLTVTRLGQVTTSTISDDEKTLLGELFTSANLNYSVNAGGTMYLTFDLTVERLDDIVTVHD